MSPLLPSATRSGDFHFKLNDLLGREPIVFSQDDVSCATFQRNVLVTGAAGSIGRELCLLICEQKPEKLILVDQAETALVELEELILSRHSAVTVCSYVASITDSSRMAGILGKTGPDIIFHAAAYKHVPVMEKHPYEAIHTNLVATKKLADLAVSFAVKKFIFVSTDKAINPVGVMGITKRLAELYLQKIRSVTQFVTVRFGNVLGSAGSVTTVFKRQIEKGGPVTVVHPQARRFFITSQEACQLVLLASSIGTHGDTLILKMGSSVSIVSIAKRMIEMYSSQEKDINIIFTGLRHGEKLDEDLWHQHELSIPTQIPNIHITRQMSTHGSEIDILEQSLRIRFGMDQEVVRLLDELGSPTRRSGPVDIT